MLSIILGQPDQPLTKPGSSLSSLSRSSSLKSYCIALFCPVCPCLPQQIYSLVLLLIKLQMLTLKSYFFQQSFLHTLESMEIASPFINCINQCKHKMKKLRKKIYKNLKAKQSASPASSSSKLSKSEHQQNPLQAVLHAGNTPQFLLKALAKSPVARGLRDISMMHVPETIDFEQLRSYADQQEQQVQEMLQNKEESSIAEENEFCMGDEQNSTFHRMNSRRWLQSTEMDDDDEEFMSRDSKISLRQFELFPMEDDSLSLQSQMSHLRDTNGFLTIESHNYLEENLFPF